VRAPEQEGTRRIAGIGGERASKRGQRRRRLARGLEHAAQRGIGAGVGGAERQGLAQCRARLVGRAEALAGQREVEPGAEMAPIEHQRGSRGCGRGTVLAEREAHGREVGMRRRARGPRRERALDQRRGLRAAPLLLAQQAEEMQRVGVFGSRREHGEVGTLGLVPASALVRGQRSGQFRPRHGAHGRAGLVIGGRGKSRVPHHDRSRRCPRARRGRPRAPIRRALPSASPERSPCSTSTP
jgi:hypothetical protein